jgi:hypothetical protein
MASWSERARYAGRRFVRHPVDRKIRRTLNRHRRFDPIFVTGLMGSGTSLVSVVMASNLPVAGLVKEGTSEIARRSGLWLRPADSYDSIERYLADLKEQPGWQVSPERERMQALYRGRATRPDEPIVDKGPAAHMLRARFLNQCFPRAPFVIVVRDPVASIEGLRRKWKLFGRASLRECLEFYCRLHEESLSLFEEIGISPIVVDFDSFTNDEHMALGRLASRLKMSPVSRTVTIESRPNVPGKGVRNVTAGRVTVMSGTSRASYQRMSHDEIDEIHQATMSTYQRMLNMARS